MDSKFPIVALAIVLGIVAVIAAVSFVAFLARSKQRGGGDTVAPYQAAKGWYVPILLAVPVMIASWALNMGWYRFVFTIIPIPLIHTIVFLVISIKAANRASVLQNFKKYMILSLATYFPAYALFPDGSDIGEMYFFFGLIHNDAAATIMVYVAILCFAINVVALILMSDELKKIKRHKQKQSLKDREE